MILLDGHGHRPCLDLDLGRVQGAVRACSDRRNKLLQLPRVKETDGLPSNQVC
jgi:hypothetical protein